MQEIVFPKPLIEKFPVGVFPQAPYFGVPSIL